MAERKFEERYMAVGGVEARVAAGDDAKRPVIRGIAVPWNSITEIGGMFREQFAPGAFDESLSKGDPVMLWNHNSDLVLGRMSAGTARFESSERGLMAENDPPETQWGNDALTLVKRGDVKGMSVRFIVTQETWEAPKTKRDIPLRTVNKAELIEVSLTAFPAYKRTSAQVRSAEEVLADIPAECLTAGQAAPPATKGGGAEMDILSRRLALAGRRLSSSSKQKGALPC